MPRLTKSQKIILLAAKNNIDGTVRAGPADRKGTRVIKIDVNGHPVIASYGNPFYFLVNRGLLRKLEVLNPTYQITEKGRKALE